MSTNQKARTSVQSAIADPFGARLAILEYGRLAGWPDLSIGPIQLRGKENEWTSTLNNAQPLWLGVLWQHIEVSEEKRARDQTKRAKEPTKEKEVNPVPILQWTESTGTEPGTYSATVETITEEEGNFGPQLKFIFTVLDEDGDKTDQHIFGWTSAKWGEKAKLYKWAKQLLLKKCPAPEQPLDTDKLLGKKCDLVIAARKKQDGTMGSGIEDVFPYRTVNAIAREDDDEDAEKNPLTATVQKF